MTIDNHGPLRPEERVHALDMIRGFALLGILLMNIEYFQRPMQAVMLGFDGTQTGVDHWVALFAFTFVQGKFYTMFSLLFGIGFVVFLDRALAKGAAARWLFVRRLLVLMAIGAAHAFLVWSGDILLAYAITGLSLLLFVNTSAGRLWKWGAFFYLVPTLLTWLAAVAIAAALQSPEGPEVAAQFDEGHQQLLADIAHGDTVYRTGAYAEAVAWRIHEISYMYLGGGAVFFLPGILGMFLIGAAFARARVFHEPDANRHVFRRMVVYGYLVGIPTALYWGANGSTVNYQYPTPAGAIVMTAAALAAISLCLAYVGTLMLLLRTAPGGRVLMKLAPAGRMALTNYLTHSLVFTLLFYGYGLGWYGEYGRAATTVMALVLYGAQVVGSRWWLERYRIGPMEWLWRTATYGRVQPLRLAQSAA